MLGKSPLWGSWIQHESTFATFDHYKHTFVTCRYRKILALIRYARYAPHGLKAVFLTSCQCGLSPMLAIIGTQLARSPLVVWGGGVHSATLCTAMLRMPVFHSEEGSHILRLTILPPKMFHSFELLIQGSWQECYAILCFLLWPEYWRSLKAHPRDIVSYIPPLWKYLRFSVFFFLCVVVGNVIPFLLHDSVTVSSFTG